MTRYYLNVQNMTDSMVNASLPTYETHVNNASFFLLLFLIMLCVVVYGVANVLDFYAKYRKNVFFNNEFLSRTRK